MNPPEWTRTEVLEFPGSAAGPWARWVVEPDAGHRHGALAAAGGQRPRLRREPEKRTLTNLYNQRPAWLDLAHRKLDEAVFAAYGWDPAIGTTSCWSGC